MVLDLVDIYIHFFITWLFFIGYFNFRPDFKTPIKSKVWIFFHYLFAFIVPQIVYYHYYPGYFSPIHTSMITLVMLLVSQYIVYVKLYRSEKDFFNVIDWLGVNALAILSVYLAGT